MKKGLIIAFLFVILCAIITFFTYRTLIFVEKAPTNNIENKQTTVKAIAVVNLSNAIKYKVITNKDANKNNYANHEKFWNFLKETYPDVFKTLKVEKIHNYNYLLKWEGKENKQLPILLTAHYDTVDVEEKTLEKWKFPPYEGKIYKDRVWGRGALDNKASLIAIFEAINNLIKNNYTPQRDIYFAFGHDEETGGLNGAVKIAKFLKEKNIKFDLILDEGGRVAKKKNGEQTAYIGISEKGRYLININVEDKAIHASNPYPESSITQLAKVIKALNRNQMRAKLTPQTMEYLENTLNERDLTTKILLANQDVLKPLLIAKLSKDNSDNAIIRTTTAFTMLQGAGSANAVPQIAQVTVDFRIIPTQTPKDVKKHVEQVLNRSLKKIKYSIEEISAQEPTKISDTKSQAFNTLKREINSFFPSANIVPYMVPAGTDARNYDSLSNNVYRFLPISVSNEDYALMHGINENIEIENYSRMIDFYESFLKNNY